MTEKNYSMPKNFPKQSDINEMTDFFKVLGDPTRLKILFLLFEHEACVTTLAQKLNALNSTISHQLNLMRKSKIVDRRKIGNTSIYYILDNTVRLIIKKILEQY